MAFTYQGEEVDLGFGRGWLSRPAANSLFRLDARIGHAWQITEAGRYYWQQAEHYANYLRYGSPIALSPDAPSIHQKGGAIDTNERITWLLNEYGWFHTVYRWINGQYVLVEEWHYEYFWEKDQHINEGIPAGSGGVIVLPTPESQEVSDMRVIAGPNGGQYYADEYGFDPTSDFFYTPNGPDKSPTWVDNIIASWILGGKPEGDAGNGGTTTDNQWVIELARHQSELRWKKKRGQITADTLAALTPVIQLMTPTIKDSVIQAAIDKAIANVKVSSEISDEDKAEIARIIAELLKSQTPPVTPPPVVVPPKA